MIDTDISIISAGEIMTGALKMKTSGFRLVQICAVRTAEGYELTYSFGKEYEIKHLRVQLGTDEEIASISDIFSPAFLYENEISDLFGAKIKMINLDYHGNLYRLHSETPFKN